MTGDFAQFSDSAVLGIELADVGAVKALARLEEVEIGLAMLAYFYSSVLAPFFQLIQVSPRLVTMNLVAHLLHVLSITSVYLAMAFP